MIAVTLIGLFTTRYVLQALGISDYGLYNVVAGLIAMLNVISTAMHTTTRRYINVEMGKADGNLNKIFNVCLCLHFGFALFIFILAETVGLYYIYHYLNIPPGKLNDALFVFHISTIVSVIGLMNVPYQGLLSAYEKFSQMAIIDFSTTLLKIPLVVLLIHYQGNALRFYAVGMCLISFSSFVLYQYACYRQYHPVVTLRRYWDKKLYREILVFNNYTALGATAYIGRSQGAVILVNLFFGTIVNGAFAIAYQIENFLFLFICNLGTASEPQITQSYSAGDITRTYNLAEKISKYSIFIMLLFVFPIYVNLEFLLKAWLGQIPEGTISLCKWILFSLFVRSLAVGISPVIQATGRLKWFQIIGSSLMLAGLPLSFFLLKLGMFPEVVIIVFIGMDLLGKLVHFWLLKKMINFNLAHFFRVVYLPFIYVIIPLSIYLPIYYFLRIDSVFFHCLNLFVTVIYTILSILVGLTKEERVIIMQRLLKLFHFSS